MKAFWEFPTVNRQFLLERKSKPKFSVSCGDQGPVSLIEVTGDSEKDPQALKKAFDVVADLNRRGRVLRILDVRKADWMTVELWGELTADLPRLRAAEGDVAIVAAPGKDSIALAGQLGLLDLMNCTDDLAYALKFLSEMQPGPLAEGRLMVMRHPEIPRLVRLAGSLEPATEPLFDTFLKDFPEGVALDCEYLLNLSPEGVGSLIRVAKSMRDGGPKVHFAGLRGPVFKLLTVTGLAKMLAHFPDAESAVAALN